MIVQKKEQKGSKKGGKREEKGSKKGAKKEQKRSKIRLQKRAKKEQKKTPTLRAGARDRACKLSIKNTNYNKGILLLYVFVAPQIPKERTKFASISPSKFYFI